MIWLIIFIISIRESSSQSFPELQFEHITVKDGLSNNNVTSIVEDKQGFIWVGTSNGLNRYDGYRFKQYYHSNTDSNSLINNSVQRLYCDAKGRIWISTEDGVSCFIPAEFKFISFSTKLKPPFQLKGNGSVGVYEDEKGVLWLSNQLNVIYQVLPDITLKEVIINIPAFIFFNLSIQGYDNIFRDRTGSEWAFKANRIYKINKATKQPEKTFDLFPLVNTFILKMTQDEMGNYFVTTFGNGFIQFLPEMNFVKPVSPSPAKIFTDITEWNFKKKKWHACLEANQGLYLMNGTNTISEKYGYIPGDPSSIQGNVFNQSYADTKGNLWIASNKGISRIISEKNIFDVIPVTEPGTINYQLNRAGPVYGFFENENSIWVSKRFVSTLEMDTAFRVKNFYSRLYPLTSNLSYYNNGWAYYFYKKQNDLYITTDSGLVVYDLAKSVSRIYFPPQLTKSTDIRTMVPFNDNEILIRSFSNGLFVFNTLEKKFTRQFTNSNICPECIQFRINYLFKTRQNEIFISTSYAGKGLFIYNHQAGSFKPVKAVNDEQYSMQASDLYGMDEDKDGNLWITSKSGLFIYNPQSNTILKQNNDNDQIGGLSRICFDNNGNAWANGSSGVWCYLLERKKWISFNGQDGLPGSQYDGIITKRKNGDIVTGLEGALAIFHPEKLTQQFNGSPVILTEASIAGRVFPFSLVNGVEKKLVLSPGQNSFSTDFAILNYLNPASSRYYYKLSPVMKDFQLNDNGHINFNGLSPGHYTLYVKASDKAGNIFDQEDILRIVVEPKWYQTNLFKAGCLLLAGLLVLYVVRRRITTIRKESSFKQKIAETEMQALRAQMNPHFIFNSLNSIENFILHNEKRLASDYLNKFSTLIRNILDSSRNEVVPIARDMEALKLYVDLEQLRFNNKFSYQSYVDQELLNGDYKVPSLLIQPYVENAIVHGIAHSDKSDLQLTVHAALDGDHIKYVIQDNGVGRIQAAAYNRHNKPGHKSVGLQITEDRILRFNRPQKANGAILFTDLYDENHQPAGTKVEIRIKYA